MNDQCVVRIINNPYWGGLLIFLYQHYILNSMFGHKGGKIEKDLERIRGNLQGLRDLTTRLLPLTQGESNKIAVALKMRVVETQNDINYLIELSRKIHDLIDKEL